MKTFEVTIRAIITKTFTCSAESENTAIEEATEQFHVGHEFDVPEKYEQEIVAIKTLED